MVGPRITPDPVRANQAPNPDISVVRTSGCWWWLDRGERAAYRILRWPDSPTGVFLLGETSEAEQQLLADLCDLGARMIYGFATPRGPLPLVFTLPVLEADRLLAESLRPAADGFTTRPAEPEQGRRRGDPHDVEGCELWADPDHDGPCP